MKKPVKTLDMGLIKKLRDMTSAGVVDCKQALAEAKGDVDKAVAILRKKGAALALKKASRKASQGLVEAYIHLGGKIGVLVEVNCETDFVARNEDFKKFTKDLAMQVAATNPRYLSREDVDKKALQQEKDILKARMKGKPANIIEKALPGKLEKFYSSVCLLEQPFIKDDKLTIKDYLSSVVGKIGENIIIRRFTRFQVGVE